MDANSAAGLGLTLLLLTIAPAGSAESGSARDSGKPHGPHVVDGWHEPPAPRRGATVHVFLQVLNDTDLDGAVLTYCRAERYSCAPSVAMRQINGTAHTAAIEWNGVFFADDVYHVGYSFTLKHSNGTRTHSPADYWPYRPDVLPPEAGIYYFYELPAETAKAPLPGPVTLFAVAATGLGLRRLGR